MLSRRQFLSLLATGVAAESLFPLLDPSLHAEVRAELASAIQDTEVHLKKRYTAPNNSYGSGSFGNWIADRQGLPCYQYTCNQLEDSSAVTPVETAWRAPTDQTHQIGNDRILAAASNYGYIQVRQDEGGPKLLNDFQPEQGLFGSGIGYLTDGKEVLATYYPGTGKSFDRFFGMGYLRKQVTGVNYSADQTIFAPFGDDPVLISEVVIASQSPNAANLHWFEYWGCQIYPLSWQTFAEGQSANIEDPIDPVKINGLRRDFAQRIDHSFQLIQPGQNAPGIDPPAVGLLQTSQLQPRKQQRFTTAVQEESAAGLKLSPAQLPPVRPPTATAEATPPPTFLASLDQGPLRLLTNAATFFGESNASGRAHASGPDTLLVPDRILRPAELAKALPGNGVPQPILPNDLTASGPESALILDKPFILEAGQTVTLRFLYGYLPEGFSATELLAKYQAPEALAKTSAAWKEEGIQLTIDSDPWVERETRWHSYYLRGGFTYDDRFNEHIVSQGSVYQYCMGYQGAARDPLQHALPLVFGDADLAKQVLRYTLKSQSPDGRLPYAITGDGSPMPNAPQPSDLDLWLLWLASEYVLATRDTAFLEEKLPTSPLTPNGPTATVRELLARGYRHLTQTIGAGRHGLLRGLSADWNAQLYDRGQRDNLRQEIHQQSESLMNAAMAAYVLDHYARMCRYSGDPKAATEASDFANRQRQAVRNQWAGKWFKRLWLGPTGGWLGDNQDARMWLDGQPWAILGGSATGEQRQTLIHSIDELLRKPSRIGAKQVSKKVDWPGVVPGETTNGGIYDTLTGPLIWALAITNPAMAYEEWVKNSRANHAEVYRDIWYGIWSGPDVYCSSDSDHAGQTGYDWGLADPDDRRHPNSYRGLSWTAWPVMNMHRHAWPLYSAAKLLGIEFTETGLDLAPAIPKPAYSFRSKLVGVEKNAAGYRGWYAPRKAGNYTIRLRLPPEENTFKTLTVNETNQPIIRVEGHIQFTATSTHEKPLRWLLSSN